MLRFASSLGRLGFTCNDKLYICHPAHVLPGVVRHCPRVGRPLIHPKPHRLGCEAASPVLAPTRLTRSHDSKVPLDHRFNLADTVSAVADDVFFVGVAARFAGESRRLGAFVVPFGQRETAGPFSLVLDSLGTSDSQQPTPAWDVYDNSKGRLEGERGYTRV